MKLSLEVVDANWQLVLLLAIGLALTKRVLRNFVKIVTGLWAVFGWHRHSIWRTRKLYLPSINPHSGNMDWAGYKIRQFGVWIRQWAFGEARWLKPAELSTQSARTSLADSSSSGDTARGYAPGTVEYGAESPHADQDQGDDESRDKDEPQDEESGDSDR